MNIKNFPFKKYKFIAVLFCLVGLVPLNGATGILLPSKLCVQCHMMKPEYYTWQVSSHSGVSCVSCHIPPDARSTVNSYKEAIKNIYQLATGKYVSPIKMLRPTSDAACDRCHNMSGKDKSRSGALNVNHKIHQASQVRCFKCHRGIAHGKISERGVTLESDYPKWEPAMAQYLMKDKQFITPDMDMCFVCHQLRKVSVECKTCHNKTVTPATHRSPSFKQETHGKAALNGIRECDKCHRFMSAQKPEGLKDDVKYLEFLKNGQKQEGDSAALYSRTNTQCRDCHSKRPASHQGNFKGNHSPLASQNREKCMTCHDDQYLKGSKKTAALPGRGVTEVGCSDCHPSIHNQNVQYMGGYHPTPLPAKPRITKSCFECHPEKLCVKCHGT